METTQTQDNVQTDIPQRLVESLREHLGEKLVAVVLYGSRARGDEREHSDWDFLVIAKNLPEKVMERHWFIREGIPKDLYGISVLAKTPQEIDHRLSELFLDIALDGIIHYDPKGYADNRLQAVRAEMDAKGLYRVIFPNRDMAYYWKVQPKYPWRLDWNPEPYDC